LKLATVQTGISHSSPSLTQICRTDRGQASASIKIFIESKQPPYYQEKNKGVCKNLYNKVIPGYPRSHWVGEALASLPKGRLKSPLPRLSEGSHNKKGQHQMVPPLFLNPPLPPLIRGGWRGLFTYSLNNHVWNWLPFFPHPWPG
jgi:hypothetical protein